MPLGTHYGGIVGLTAIGGPEVIRALVVPNLAEYDRLILKEAMGDEAKRKEAEMVIRALIEALGTLDDKGPAMTNGYAGRGSELGLKLEEKVGDLVGGRILDMGRPGLAKALIDI